jgi:HEAT repeat protein
MRFRPVMAGVLMLLAVGGAWPLAQQPPRPPGAMGVEEATTLTQGWAFLAQGDLERASVRARDALTRSPRSAAALALTVEVAIARSGPAGGLDAYDQWLGGRAFEEPAVVRRIAAAFLKEVAAQAQNPAAQFKARGALAEDGDAEARAVLDAAAAQGNAAEARELAARGDARAIRALADGVAANMPNALAAIQALGESGSRAAAPVLLAKLADPRSEIRGAAAEALGHIGGGDVLPKLRPLLTEPSLHVRIKVASALYRLGDASGLPVLQEQAASNSAAARLVAAEALASHPDATWEALVRGLASAREPDVRLGAARLIARFDQPLATSVFQGLASEPNTAIREEAGRTMAASSTDLRTLRMFLRSTDRLTRVEAADAILRLLR